MSLREYIYEGLPAAEIVELIDRASDAMAERSGIPQEQLVPTFAPFSLAPPIDPDNAGFSAVLTEAITVDVRLVLGELGDGTKSRTLQASFEHSVPIPLWTALDTSPDPSTTLALFLAAYENEISDIRNSQKMQPEEEAVVQKAEELLEQFDDETSRLAEEEPELAHQLAVIIGRYVTKEQTCVSETREMSYRIATSPSGPILISQTTLAYECRQLVQTLSITLHTNGILTDSVVTDVEGLKSLFDNINEPSDLDAEFAAIMGEDFGQSVRNEVALEQVKKDILTIRAIIRAWQRPAIFLED